MWGEMCIRDRYYISGGYYSEDGILRYADMDFSRYNFAANISSQITDWMLSLIHISCQGISLECDLVV